MEQQEELTIDTLIEWIDDVDTKNNQILNDIKKSLIDQLRQGTPPEIVYKELMDLITNIKQDKCPELDIYRQQQEIKSKYPSLLQQDST